MQYTEVRGKLSVFGTIFRVCFWGWQILMLVWGYGFTSQAATMVSGSTSEAFKAGASAGVVLGWGLILFFWVAGSVIFGFCVLLTRPARMLVPVQELA